MPAPAQPPRPARPRFLLPMRAWLIVLGGFGLGLLLFLVIWLGQRDSGGEPDATTLPAASAEPGPRQPSLPAPQQPDDAGDPAADAGEEGGLFVMPDAPQRPIEPPSPVAEPTPPGVPAAPDGPATGDLVTATDSRPVPIRAPEPRYPRAALRRGESGEVVVRVLVGANGRPREVEVTRSSSYPALDQAALNAVRRWRFQPAVSQGQPVEATVQVPVVFSPRG